MALTDFKDIWDGVRHFDTAAWLAQEDTKTRYARTALGPWWNVLSAVMFVVAMGFTYGTLFRQPLDYYLPYVAASLACWNLLSGFFTDSTTSLMRGADIITSYRLPLSTQVYRVVVDKFILFAHFSIFYAILLALLKFQMEWVALLALIPTLLIYFAFGTGVGLFFSVLGARFRDVNPAINSLMLLVFLVTPIIWQKITLTPENAWFVEFNPFYHLIEIGRRPLLGEAVDPHSWMIAGFVSVAALLIGSSVFAFMRRRIYFWI
jgi:ABC-type polysaccharide/polyol phosphate export permease